MAQFLFRSDWTLAARGGAYKEIAKLRLKPTSRFQVYYAQESLPYETRSLKTSRIKKPASSIVLFSA